MVFRAAALLCGQFRIHRVLMIIGSLSQSDLAATNLAFAVNALIFVPLLGFGTAIQTLVGHHIGAERVREASRTVRNAFLLGTAWTGEQA